MEWQCEYCLLLHLHHLLFSCRRVLLFLSEAEDLGMQLVVLPVEITCLWVCAVSYNVILAVNCRLRHISQACTTLDLN